MAVYLRPRSAMTTAWRARRSSANPKLGRFWLWRALQRHSAEPRPGHGIAKPSFQGQLWAFLSVSRDGRRNFTGYIDNRNFRVYTGRVIWLVCADQIKTVPASNRTAPGSPARFFVMENG